MPITLQRSALLTATILLLGGCAERDEEPPPARGGEEQVWKNQMRGMDRAREVETMLQEQAERRRRELERQGG